MDNFQVHQKFKQIKNKTSKPTTKVQEENMGAEEGFLGLTLGATKAN